MEPTSYPPKVCPQCGYENLPLAARCHCGAILRTRAKTTAPEAPVIAPGIPGATGATGASGAADASAKRILMIGVGLFALAITLAGGLSIARTFGGGHTGSSSPSPTAAAVVASPSPSPSETPSGPIPTMPDTPVVTPTPRPATPKPAATNDWNTATYKVAMAYTSDMNATYVSKIPGAVAACATLEDAACQSQIAAGVTAAANAHITWMSKHTPAHCFADAYTDDRGIAKAYVSAASALKGGNVAGWQSKIAAAQSQSSSFIHNFSAYFKDCK